MITQETYEAAVKASFNGVGYVDKNFVLHADGSLSVFRDWAEGSGYQDQTYTDSKQVVDEQTALMPSLWANGTIRAQGYVDASQLFFTNLAVERGLMTVEQYAAYTAALSTVPVLGQDISSGKIYSAAEVAANAPGAVAAAGLEGVAAVQTTSQKVEQLVASAESKVREPVAVTAASLDWTPGVAEKVAALYAAFFNRAPDLSGLNFWTGELATRGSAAYMDIAEGFAGHPKFAVDYGGLGDRDFVLKVYVNMLGNAGDTMGVNFWTSQLAGGMTRSDMVATFVDSALSADLEAALARGDLFQSEYEMAKIRQDTIINKAKVGTEFVARFGSATVPSNLGNLDADAAYKASIAALEGISASRDVAADRLTDMDRMSLNVSSDAGVITLVGQHEGFAGSALELAGWI